MVQASQLSAKHVCRFSLELFARVNVASLVELLHGVFLRVGVEVTQQEHVVSLCLLLHRVSERDQGLSLLHTVSVGVALTVTRVLVSGAFT